VSIRRCLALQTGSSFALAERALEEQDDERQIGVSPKESRRSNT
jgi:hypothetical protein